MNNPVNILREEHKLLLNAIDTTRQIQNIEDNEQYHRLIHDAILFFRNFNEICHFPKEDRILYPLLQGRSPNLSKNFLEGMYNSHEDLEQFISEIVDAHVLYDYRTVRIAMKKYLEELTEQIELEEKEILSTAALLLSEEEKGKIYNEFLNMDARQGVIVTVKNTYYKMMEQLV